MNKKILIGLGISFLLIGIMFTYFVRADLICDYTGRWDVTHHTYNINQDIYSIKTNYTRGFEEVLIHKIIHEDVIGDQDTRDGIIKRYKNEVWLDGNDAIKLDVRTSQEVSLGALNTQELPRGDYVLLHLEGTVNYVKWTRGDLYSCL